MTLLGFLDNLIAGIVNRLRRLFLPYLLYRSGKIYPKISRNVIRLSKTTVVKQGVPAELHLEAQATRYVALHTSIPVPTVYDVWTGRDGQGYLAMEYKEGEVIQRRWRGLSHSQKTSVMCALSSYVEQLRALPQPCPQGWIGSPPRGTLFDLDVMGGTLCGPFSSEREFNDWRISAIGRMHSMHPPFMKELERLRCAMSDDLRITFTHGDIARKNVLVDVQEERVRIVALIDWEQAGWHPEHWEAHKFTAGRFW